MEKKKATNENASSPNTQTYDMPSHVQRARILNALEQAGCRGMSTIELREQENIMHPSGRVKELREMGYPIITDWTTSLNAQGNPHRCARYILKPESEEAAA